MNEDNAVFNESFNNSVSDNQTAVAPPDIPDVVPDVPENPVLDTSLDESPEELPPVEESTEPTIDSDLGLDTVSGSDVRTFLDSSVSSGDFAPSVSSGDTYNISIETAPDVPIWEKSINEYTVSEGLLLLIFILLLVEFCIRRFKSNQGGS